MKKGFTLAEILGVIVIIGLLLILIVPPIINRISNSGDEAKETENEFIYNAADSYIREHPEKYPPGKSGKYCILIQDLIDEGKLVEPVTDVVTGENLSDKSVLVTIYSTGTREYEIKEGEECKDISALPMIDFIVEPIGSSWVKKRTVTIIYPTIEGNYQARYRREDENSNNWINDSAYNNGGRHTNIVFNKSSKSTQIEAQLKGNQIISGRVNIVNVDSDIPTIDSIQSNGTSGSSVRVLIRAHDNLSGLDGIYFNTVKSTPNVNASGWKDFSTNDSTIKSYTTNLSTGTYYVYVKDKAGNISNGTKNAITITNATYHSERWYCPSGYTSSGSGSSMRCTKTTYTNAQYHAATETCTRSGTINTYATCNSNRQHCGIKSTTYTKSGSTCYGNWVKVTGRADCKGGVLLCNTNCQSNSNYDECDESKYNENGPVGCVGTADDKIYVHYPTIMCRNIKNTTKTSAYYSCSSGTLVGTRCKKTTTTSPYHQSAYYSCSSGTLVGGNMCFRNS